MNKDRTFEICYKAVDGKKQVVQFSLVKIPPIRGWEICELFREAVGNPEVLMKLTADVSSPEQAAKRIIMGLLISMSRHHVKEIRDALFEYVQFKSPDQAKPMQLQGLEDMAFENLDPFAIYEVMGRCFSVNFTGYFNEMMNRFGIDVSALGKETEPEPDSGTSQ